MASSKAISVKTYTSLLVCSSAFGVTPAVTERALRRLARLEGERTAGAFRYIFFRQSPYGDLYPFGNPDVSRMNLPTDGYGQYPRDRIRHGATEPSSVRWRWY